MACEHELHEMDTAAYIDGLCPLCQRAEIERLKHELEVQRDSQISAVNQMLAAEQREAATIERCAQVAEACRANTYPGRVVREAITVAIRALKDKP